MLDMGIYAFTWQGHSLHTEAGGDKVLRNAGMLLHGVSTLKTWA